MIDARAGEETVVDVELSGTMMPKGFRTGGERSDPVRGDPWGRRWLGCPVFWDACLELKPLQLALQLIFV